MKTSLIMATYNGEKYIKEQLDSIKFQSKKLDEVIICDDGSTDNTVNIVLEYIKKNNLENWTLEKNTVNLGYSANFSNMLKKANGDIIFLADQDDIWYKEKIEKMSNIMEKNENIYLLASNLTPLYMSNDAPKINYEQFDNSKELIKIGINKRWIKPIRPGCSFAIRKELINYYLKVYDKKYPHDCILWNVASLLDKSYLLNVSTMQYRRHSENASNLGKHSKEYRIKCIQDEIEIMELVLRKLDLQENIINIINKQLQLYKSRIEILKEKKIIKCISLLKYINYYGRLRFWMTDLYYCIRERK